MDHQLQTQRILTKKLENQLARLTDTTGDHLRSTDHTTHLKTKETQITGYPILNMRVMSFAIGGNLITMCSEYANQLITYDV